MKKDKTIKFKSSSKEMEQFERVKLDETKVINSPNVDLNLDEIHLEDLKLQLKNAIDKEIKKSLKKQIKALEKKIAKSKK